MLRQASQNRTDYQDNLIIGLQIPLQKLGGSSQQRRLQRQLRAGHRRDPLPATGTARLVGKRTSGREIRNPVEVRVKNTLPQIIFF